MSSNRDNFYSKLRSIGIRVNSTLPENYADIESALVDSFFEIDTDGRLVGLIFSWLKVHHLKINADKLFREYDSRGLSTPWFSGVCSYLVKELKDHRFKKGLGRNIETHHWMNIDQTPMVSMKGLVEYLKEENIVIAIPSIRIRESDILSPKELCLIHTQYRNRCLYGSNWRSDIISSYQSGKKTSYQIAKELGIRWNVVNAVVKDYEFVFPKTS